VADLADIENVLVSSITQIVYPNGTGNPSIVSTPCKIFRGWPIPKNLDADLTAGKINISVYPNDNEQKTTRYPREWKSLPAPTPTLTVSVSTTTITLGGTPSSPLNVAIIVNGTAYIYPVQPSDTTTSIATALAAMVQADTTATSSGPVITIPYAHSLNALVGAFGTAVRETKRQKRSFQITFWCPNPTVRDLIVAPVDAALADIDFLSLPDGTAGRLVYERSKVSDRVEREGLYRRDLFYSVEYGTTDSLSAAQIVDFVLYMTDQNGIPLDSPGNLLLADDGQAILTDDGQRITIEENRLISNDGTYILTDDGQRINLDS
jgi:hypothetical protein